MRFYTVSQKRPTLDLL